MATLKFKNTDGNFVKLPINGSSGEIYVGSTPPEDNNIKLFVDTSIDPPNIPQHNYSINEQIIGTWIDGKPIYEKTVTVTTPSTNSSLLYTDEEMETLIDYKGILYESATRQFNVPFSCVNNGGTHLFGYILKSDAVVHLFWFSTSYYLSKELKLTLQYTKKDPVTE